METIKFVDVTIRCKAPPTATAATSGTRRSVQILTPAQPTAPSMASTVQTGQALTASRRPEIRCEKLFVLLKNLKNIKPYGLPYRSYSIAYSGTS